MKIEAKQRLQAEEETGNWWFDRQQAGYTGESPWGDENTPFLAGKTNGTHSGVLVFHSTSPYMAVINDEKVKSFKSLLEALKFVESKVGKSFDKNIISDFRKFIRQWSQEKA